MIENDMQFKKRHSKHHFYKYAKLGSALQIIRTGQIRCNCPIEFNDPFDTQVGLCYDFCPSDLKDAGLQKFEELINAITVPEFRNQTSFSEAVMLARSHLRQIGSLPDIYRIGLAQRLDSLAAKFEDIRQDFIVERQKVVKRMRMTCFSECFDNILMWSHYGEGHTGAVLRLSVAESADEDDPLWLAHEVNYLDNPIPLVSLTQAINRIFGLETIDEHTLNERLVCTKHSSWNYESEWRLWTLVEDGNSSDFSFRFSPTKFDQVYFGCMCDKKARNEFIQIAYSINNDIRFFQAIKDPCRYSLNFHEIT